MAALLRSRHSFAYRQRAWTSNLAVIGALVNDDADDIDDERDERDDLDELSDTMESGDDIDETEFAKDDRRWETYDWGEDEKCGCHFSFTWAVEILFAWAMAYPIDEDLSM